MEEESLPDNTELSSVMRMLMKIQDFREEAWTIMHKNERLPEELLKLREATERCTQRVHIEDGQVYPKEIDKDLYTFGDSYDSVLCHANCILQRKYGEKSGEPSDCICGAVNPLSTKESNRKSIESAPLTQHTEPVCSKYASEERDMPISGVSASTVEHPIAGPSTSADLSNFSSTTGDNSLNPSNSVNNKFILKNNSAPTDAKKQEDSYTHENFVNLFECLNISSQKPVIESYNETNESDFTLPSDQTDSSGSESIDEDSPEYEKKLMRHRMKDMLKFGYRRIKTEMGKTYYWSIRPERRSNDFRVYSEDNPMLPKEKPASDNDKAVVIHKQNEKMSCKPSDESKLNNDITLLAVKDCTELNKSESHFGKHAKRMSTKEKKSLKSKGLATSTDVQNSRQPKRKISAKSPSKLSNQKNLVRKMPGKSSAKSSTSCGKQKGRLVNKCQKSISSTASPIKKVRKISRNVLHSAKQKITKPKSTKVSVGSGKKVELQSSKKLLLVAEKNMSSKNTGSKLKKISEKTMQKQTISSKQSSQISTVKLRLRSRLNASSELQNKIKWSKKKPAKDSSVQKPEAKVKNISLGSSKSEKRKAESDDSCKKISRNVLHTAKQKITKPTEVAQLKPSSSQLFTKSKSLMKNLFSPDSTSISDQPKMFPKSTRVSARFGKKVELQSSKKSLLVAEKNASSKSTGSKFKKISEKTRQKQTISSRKTSAMKLRLRSRLNASSKLQNKRKPAKGSSIQKSEEKVKNISPQSSKSKRIKKGKDESDNASSSVVTRQRRNVSKKGK